MEKVNSQVCAEVLILLKYYLRPEEFSRIPKEKLQFISQNADKDFIMEIDEKKPFEEQNISKDAKALILSLYKNYFITKEQGRKLDNLLRSIEMKSKETISFEERIKQINKIKAEEANEDVLTKEEPKELVKVGVFQKIINKFKALFSRK